MHSAVKWGLVLAAWPVCAATLPYFSVLSEDAGAWPAILSSIGLERQPAGVARVFVARTGAAASTEWNARVNGGAILILEGESSLAEMFGFRRGKDNVKVNSLTDVHRPALPIIWETGARVAGLRAAGWRQGLRAGTLEQDTDDGRAAPRRRRGLMDRGAARRARV